MEQAQAIEAIKAKDEQRAHDIVSKGQSLLEDDVTKSAKALMARFGDLEGIDLLEVVLKDLFPGRITVASSFGTESAVLLHMISIVDPSTPIIFSDTQKLFADTLLYQQQLEKQLGLTDIRQIKPDLASVQREDSENMLWQSAPDRCCAIRKVIPFQKALSEFDAWITGRKRFQGGERAELPVIEQDGPRIKINPLAHWSSDQLEAYMKQHDLPAHPLKERGYLSVGCTSCTRPVKAGEDPRAGRWSGQDKTECGIHFVDGKASRSSS